MEVESVVKGIKKGICGLAIWASISSGIVAGVNQLARGEFYELSYKATVRPIGAFSTMVYRDGYFNGDEVEMLSGLPWSRQITYVDKEPNDGLVEGIRIRDPLSERIFYLKRDEHPEYIHEFEKGDRILEQTKERFEEYF